MRWYGCRGAYIAYNDHHDDGDDDADDVDDDDDDVDDNDTEWWGGEGWGWGWLANALHKILFFICPRKVHFPSETAQEWNPTNLASDFFTDRTVTPHESFRTLTGTGPRFRTATWCTCHFPIVAAARSHDCLVNLCLVFKNQSPQTVGLESVVHSRIETS